MEAVLVLVVAAVMVAVAVAVLVDLPTACWRLALPNCSSTRPAFVVAAVVQALTVVPAAATVVLVGVAPPEPADSPVRRVGPTPMRRVTAHRVVRRTDGLTTHEPIRHSATHRSERERQALEATAPPLAMTALSSRRTSDQHSWSWACSAPRLCGGNVFLLPS
jgi:hypothetical protein